MFKPSLVITSLVAPLMAAFVPVKAAGDGWRLVWSDEFNAPDGSSPDPAKWSFDLGGGGWGNGELQYYTDRTQNVFHRNGCLIIRAVKENYEEWWEYTSGRPVFHYSQRGGGRLLAGETR